MIKFALCLIVALCACSSADGTVMEDCKAIEDKLKEVVKENPDEFPQCIILMKEQMEVTLKDVSDIISNSETLIEVEEKMAEMNKKRRYERREMNKCQMKIWKSKMRNNDFITKKLYELKMTEEMKQCATSVLEWLKEIMVKLV